MASQVTTFCKADEAELLRLWHTAILSLVKEYCEGCAKYHAAA
jgi:hypothetical protein